MQHFSNYFVQILVIRFKCKGVKDDPEGGRKKFQGGQLPPTFRAYRRGGSRTVRIQSYGEGGLITSEHRHKGEGSKFVQKTVINDIFYKRINE